MSALLEERDVLTYIDTLDDPKIDLVLRALQRRHDALHGQRRLAEVQDLGVGSPVVIDEVQQEYLKGLTGEIVSVGDGEDAGYVDVLLSGMSTGQLRFCHESEYRVGGEPRYLLHGVPVTCCFEPEAVAQAG